VLAGTPWLRTEQSRWSSFIGWMLLVKALSTFRLEKDARAGVLGPLPASFSCQQQQQLG